MIEMFKTLFKGTKKKSAVRLSVHSQTEMKRQEQLIEGGMRDRRDYLSPHPVDFKPATYRKVGDYYIKTLFVHKYPDVLDLNHLDDLFNMPVNNHISIHQIPINSQYFIKFLTTRINKNAKLLKEQDKRNRSDGYTKVQKEKDEELRDKIITGKENVYVVGIYIDVYAESLEELMKRVDRVQREIGRRGMTAFNADGENENAFYAVLPILIDRMHHYHDMTTSNIAELFPLSSAHMSMDSGTYYGRNKGDNSLILIDRFKLPNPNTIILAPSGKGKSTFAKQEHIQYWAQGAYIYAIDRDNEMRALTKKLGGLYLDYSKRSNFRVNPCDLRVTDDPEDQANFFDIKISFLIALYRKMADGITTKERTLLARSIRAAYEAKGFTSDHNTLFLNSETEAGSIKLRNRKLRPLTDMPILSDINAEMAKYPEMQDLLDKVAFFMEEGPGDIINGHSTVDISQYRWVSFGVRNLTDETRPIILFTIMDFIENTIKRNMDLPKDQREKVMVYSDETWSLINNHDGALYMYEYSKRCRKYGGALTTVFQNILDCYKDPEGYGIEILNNTSMTVLLALGEKAVGANELKEKLGVNDKVIRDLKRADRGNGYIITDMNRAEFELEIIPEFKDIVTASAFEESA